MKYHHTWPPIINIYGPLKINLIEGHIFLSIYYTITNDPYNLILDIKFHIQLTIRHRTFIKPIAVVSLYV